MGKEATFALRRWKLSGTHLLVSRGSWVSFQKSRSHVNSEFDSSMGTKQKAAGNK